MNFHIEVHTKDNQVEHYVIQNAKDEDQARRWAMQYFEGREFPLAPSFPDALANVKFHFYIFRIVNMEDRSVVYITGEYRSNYPI